MKHRPYFQIEKDPHIWGDLRLVLKEMLPKRIRETVILDYETKQQPVDIIKIMEDIQAHCAIYEYQFPICFTREATEAIENKIQSYYEIYSMISGKKKIRLVTTNNQPEKDR